jgi:hypothetical protein
MNLEKEFNNWAATYGDTPRDADSCKYGKSLMLEFAETVLLKSDSLPLINNRIATGYAEFCVRCDREGLPLIKLADYIKLPND